MQLGFGKDRDNKETLLLATEQREGVQKGYPLTCPRYQLFEVSLVRMEFVYWRGRYGRTGLRK